MKRKRLFRVGVYGILATMLLVLLVDPYIRQPLFGPTLEELPLCYWQDSLRREVDPDAFRDSLSSKILQWIGWNPPPQQGGRLRDEANELKLLLSLADDSQPLVRAAIAKGLRRPRPREECLPVLRRFLDDSDARVRAAAAQSIASLEPVAVEALPRLLELLQDFDVTCRMHAAWGVWQIGGKKYPEVISVLRQALSDANANTRLTASMYLRDIGADGIDALPELAACAQGDAIVFVRDYATQALAKMGRPAIPHLEKVLRDPNNDIRCRAASALGAFGPAAKSALPTIQGLQSDSDARVRESVAQALHRIDPDQFPLSDADEKQRIACESPGHVE
jgi:HEAT repeat protein